MQSNRDRMRGQPRRIIVVDTETIASPGKRLTDQVHTLRLGVACWGVWNGTDLISREYFRFRKPAEFWAWVDDRLSWKTKTTIYAHNAHFDCTVLDWWSQLVDGKFRMESDEKSDQSENGTTTRHKSKWIGQVVLERSPYYFQAFSKRGRFDLVDTCNYYHCSLADLGQSIGLPKLPMPESTDSEAKWFEYCQRDTDIAMQAMVNLLREWNSENYGPFGYTLPSLAYRAWYHTFRDCTPVPHDNEEIRKLERSAYFGGRAAAWYIGDIVPVDYTLPYLIASEPAGQYARQQGQVYILDVRSLYPSVMLRHDYPIKLLCTKDHPSITEVCDLIQDYCLIANVTLRTDNPEYPYRSNDRVTYPVGLYNTSLCTPELHYALDSGAVASVNQLAVYSRGRPFDSYITYWWQRRQQALQKDDAVQAELCKLMMNSLYGRFGMRKSRWIAYPEQMGKVPWGEWWQIHAQTGVWNRWRSVGWYAQRLQERGEHKNACPSVAAHVTSYGRMVMRGYRQLCNHRDILYQDTDSLFVLAPAYLALQRAGVLDRDCLGSLRTIHVVSHLAIRGIKNYIADGRAVITGINTQGEQYGPRCYLSPEFAGPGTLIHSGLSGSILVSMTVKRAAMTYPQDSIGSDGYTQPPLLW